MGVHINGLVDNGLGSGLRDDLSGELSTASLIVNILLALAMLVVGGFFYHEQISLRKIFGVVLCMAGVALLSLKE